MKKSFKSWKIKSNYEAVFFTTDLFGHFRRWDGENKIHFKSDIRKTFKTQKKKKNTKTNSRNRDNTIYPLMDDVHVNWINSWSFALIYFCLSSQRWRYKSVGNSSWNHCYSCGSNSRRDLPKEAKKGRTVCLNGTEKSRGFTPPMFTKLDTNTDTRVISDNFFEN